MNVEMQAVRSGRAGMLVTEAALLRGLPSSDLQRDRTGAKKQP